MHTDMDISNVTVMPTSPGRSIPSTPKFNAYWKKDDEGEGRNTPIQPPRDAEGYFTGDFETDSEATIYTDSDETIYGEVGGLLTQ